MASCGPSSGLNLGAVPGTHAKHLNASRFSDTGPCVLCLRPSLLASVLCFNDPNAQSRLYSFLKMKREIKRQRTEKRGDIAGFSRRRCLSQLRLLCKTKQWQSAPSTHRSAGVLFLGGRPRRFRLLFSQFIPTECALTPPPPFSTALSI